MNKQIVFFIITMWVTTINAATSFLQPASFPTTSMDTTFVQRRDNATDGYKPYAGRSAYHTITIEDEEKYLLRTAESRRQHDFNTMSRTEYCREYELDSEHCPQAPGQYAAVVAIGNRPTRQQTTKPVTTTQPQKPTTTGQGMSVGTSITGQPVIASQTIHNGPCTPPQHSNVFTNQILTSGQYAFSDPAFEKTMITTFRAEGGCVNDPDDSGGYTCYGISQNNNPGVDVRNLTRADAENIAHNKYYTQHGIEKLPDYIRSDVFTFGWAAGPVTGIRRFCRVLGIPERDRIDAEIVAAAENYNGDLHNDYLDNLQQHFIDVSKRNNNQKFLKGWMHRVQLTRENGCHTQTTDPISR